MYSAAINADSISTRDTNVTTSTESGDVIAYALPDGRRKIDFYTNGVFDGSAIETDDGGMCLPKYFSVYIGLFRPICILSAVASQNLLG